MNQSMTSSGLLAGEPVHQSQPLRQPLIVSWDLYSVLFAAHTALLSLNFNGQESLVQVWLLTPSGPIALCDNNEGHLRSYKGVGSLHTSNAPIALRDNNEGHLRSFRDASIKHTYLKGKVVPQCTGFPGRVICRESAQCIKNVQEYAKELYPLLDDAVSYGVRGCLYLPLFKDQYAVGVIELAMLVEKESFTDEWGEIYEAFMVLNSDVRVPTLPDNKRKGKWKLDELKPEVIEPFFYRDTLGVAARDLRVSESTLRKAREDAGYKEWPLAKKLRGSPSTDIQEANPQPEGTVNPTNSALGFVHKVSSFAELVTTEQTTLSCQPNPWSLEASTSSVNQGNLSWDSKVDTTSIEDHTFDCDSFLSELGEGVQLATQTALLSLNFNGQESLVQVWLLTPSGPIALCDNNDRHLRSFKGVGSLHTSNAPIALRDNNEGHLQSFRDNSIKHTYLKGKDVPQCTGFPGRVICRGLAQCIKNVQKYTKELYPQLDDAVSYGVRGCLYLPLFKGQYTVGVIELAMLVEKESFTDEWGEIYGAFMALNSDVRVPTPPDNKRKGKWKLGELKPEVIEPFFYKDTLGVAARYLRAREFTLRKAREDAGYKEGPLVKKPRGSPSADIQEANPQPEGTVDPTNSALGFVHKVSSFPELVINFQPNPRSSTGARSWEASNRSVNQGDINWDSKVDTTSIEDDMFDVDSFFSELGEGDLNWDSKVDTTSIEDHTFDLDSFVSELGEGVSLNDLKFDDDEVEFINNNTFVSKCDDPFQKF